MTTKTFLTLIAAVLGVDDDSIKIDKGINDGLRPGDRGVVFYQLTVGNEIKRIELGPVEVTTLEAESATTSANAGTSAKPGHLVQFEIDIDRFSPAQTVAAVREHLGDAAAADLVERYLEDLRFSPADRDPEAPIALVVKPEALAPSTHAQSRLQITAGDYAIGVQPGAARFYNETPRLEKTLAAFAIDTAPAEPTGYDFSQAQAYCEDLGARLPTEFEWEVASRHPRFEILRRFEWTSSWYLAYPGNDRREEEFGERFRVLRGSTDNIESFRPQSRRYLEPGESNSTVGFRCATNASASD